MSNLESCPKCSARFEARDALVWGGVPLFLGAITAPGVSTKVHCPGCGHSFSAQHMRFFGILSANALRSARVLAIVGAVLVAVLSSFR